MVLIDFKGAAPSDSFIKFLNEKSTQRNLIKAN